MKIEERPIDEIKPYGKNAKKHPTKQVQAIASSIIQFGFNQPIVVDKDDVIIVGHGRYLAAHTLGLEKIPVIKVDITGEQAKAYRLADNKLNESEWDMQLVIQELKDMSLSMIDLTGFDRRLVMSSDDKDDVVPETPIKARSEIGDIYELGDHKLLCGDSTKEESYTKLFENSKADMVFTDPPYNINYHGGGKKTSTGIMNDKMESAVFREFLTQSFKGIANVIKKGSALYIFHSPTTQSVFEEALDLSGFQVKYQLIWNKPSAGLGMGDYRSKHEPFFYATIKGVDPLFYGDRTNTSVIDFHKTDQQLAIWARKEKEAEKSGKTTIWTMKREPVIGYVHPTQKPVELVMYALANSSKVEDVILDPFLGSGSTLIACQKTNRTCYGIELDLRFVDVIVQRYVDYTENRNIKKNGEKIIW
jgi:site-specific DNA-methyltransferase (adenine-specific)